MGTDSDAPVEPGLGQFIDVLRPAEQMPFGGDLVKCTFTVQLFSLVFRFCFAVRHPIVKRDCVKHSHIFASLIR